MQIIDVRGPSRASDIAQFDVQLGPYLRLYNLSLKRTPDGSYRVFAPNAAGKHSASFHHALASEIIAEITKVIGGGKANGKIEQHN